MHTPTGARFLSSLVALCAALALSGAACAQSLPDPEWTDLSPQLAEYQCKPRGDEPEPASEAERARFEMRARYAALMPAYLARVGPNMADQLLQPVEGVRVAQVADTYGAPRAGHRTHDGVDIFAPRGTPVRAAAPGFVYRIDDLSLGGLSVTVVGDGGVRYFYTHFDSVPESLREGQRVETETVIGFVGNSGNAASTPTHLHFGVYLGEPDNLCAWQPINPLPLLVDRN